jgi:hypothetical protein
VSALYTLFDPEKMTKEHLNDAGKDTIDEWGSQGGLTITPPGHLVKHAHLSGHLSEEQIKALLAALLADMVKLADASKVRMTTKPKDTILDRPLSHLRVHFAGWVDVWSLRGSYFTYSDGKIEGTVEIIAANTDPKDPKHWTVSCALHEAAP